MSVLVNKSAQLTFSLIFVLLISTVLTRDLARFVKKCLLYVSFLKEVFAVNTPMGSGTVLRFMRMGFCVFHKIRMY